ncbi:MAG: hypothetical protein OQK82_08095 [Candidatus Pacearchaeota archaeon]|nr:hypothetical protein [Candidatus Pacearchaeota archaeon]
MRKKTIFQIFYVILILILFYYLNVPLKIIGIFAVFFLLVILLKGKLYRKIEKLFLDLRFFRGLNSKVKRIVIIVVFVLIFILIKQVIYFVLGLFGFDLETTLMTNINNTIVNQS